VRHKPARALHGEDFKASPAPGTRSTARYFWFNSPA
jgi:hypothetical protein